MSSEHQTSSTTTLADLPEDILSQIVDNLDIEAARVLGKSIENNYSNVASQRLQMSTLMSLIYDRQSIPKYFSKYFSEADNLLTTMAQCFVFLSGSRSLEFFIPGSAVSESDWDFYIPNDNLRIYAFMRALEKSGVKWLNPEEEVLRKLLNNGDTVSVTKAKYEHLEETGALDRVSTARGLERDTHMGRGTSNGKITIQDNVLSIVEDKQAKLSYLSDFVPIVLVGILSYRGRITNVQLIVENRQPSCTTAQPYSVFDFHSSCVQSFISPVGACHMYGKLSSASMSYPWYHNDNIDDRSLRATHDNTSDVVDVTVFGPWNKYAQRGFEYNYCKHEPHEFVIRHVRDKYSTWVKNTEYMLIPLVASMYLNNAIGNTMWYEFSDKTKRVNQFTARPERPPPSWLSVADCGVEKVQEYISKYAPHIELYANSLKTDTG